MSEQEEDALKRELAEAKDLLAELKPAIDAIRKTQLELKKVSLDTNSEAHQAKHGVMSFPANMAGFTNITKNQYEAINEVLNEFRIHKEYSDEKMEAIAAYMKALQDIVTTAQMREIVSEIQINKEFRGRFRFAWWLLGSLLFIGAAVAGLPDLIKRIIALFK